MSDSVTPWTAACQTPLSFTISRSLLRFKSTELVVLLSHSSFAAPFSFCLQSSPASGSFPMNRLFPSDGQRIGASALASVLPVNIQGWFSLGWTGLTFLQSKGFSKSLLQHHSLKTPILWHSDFFMVQLSYPYMTTGKTIAWTIRSFVSKVISLLFNMLFKFVILFLPRSKYLLISWLKFKK